MLLFFPIAWGKWKHDKNNNISAMMGVLQFVCIFLLWSAYLQGCVEGANCRCACLHTAVQVGILQQYKKPFVDRRQKAEIRSIPLISWFMCLTPWERGRRKSSVGGEGSLERGGGLKAGSIFLPKAKLFSTLWSFFRETHRRRSEVILPRTALNSFPSFC